MKAQALWIVSCTCRKIWDTNPNAPKKVPAKDAYKGSTFLKWLRYTTNKQNTVAWYIFSSKYGIIEPEHPIENYNIHFIRNSDKAIPEDTIIEQIKKHRIHKARNVYFVGSSNAYYDKLKRIFEKAGVKLHRFRLTVNLASNTFSNR